MGTNNVPRFYHDKCLLWNVLCMTTEWSSTYSGWNIHQPEYNPLCDTTDRMYSVVYGVKDTAYGIGMTAT